VILVDGNLLVHRAYHKMDFLKNKLDEHTGMEFATLRSLEYIQGKYPEHKIVICFDTRKNNKRDKCARYKSERSLMSAKFYERLSKLQLFLRQFWDLAWCEGEEADDVIYTLARRNVGKESTIIYSNDNDLLQCVNDEDEITVLKSHESNLYRYDEAKVQEKYGVPVEHLVMFRSFVGDSSDNLKGVPRILKTKLADAIFRAVDIGCDDIDVIAYMMPQYTGWSYNLQIKIEAFLDSGRWRENYDLMLLRDVHVFYAEQATKFEEFIIETLRRWEIGSLRLCEPYKAELVDPELEF
jgi:DNA polymerase-1